MVVEGEGKDVRDGGIQVQSLFGDWGQEGCGLLFKYSVHTLKSVKGERNLFPHPVETDLEKLC